MMGQSAPPKFADYTKLGGVVNMPDGCIAIHRDLNRLEKWANKNLMKFKGKCQVLHLGRNNHVPQYMLETNSSFAEESLGVLVDKLPMRQQCALALKANSIWAVLGKTFSAGQGRW